MKKAISLLSAVAVSCSVFSGFPFKSDWNFEANAADSIAIDDANFPDEIFRSYVSNSFDTNSDGALSTAEIADADSIYLNYMGVSNLKGIEHFTELTALDCSSNKIASLDFGSNTKLRFLNCSDNKLAALDISSNAKLIELYCSSNQLTMMDLSNNDALGILDCSDNLLTCLDASSNTSLMKLVCSSNNIASLSIDNCGALMELDCSENQLTSLDITKNQYLSSLICTSNTYHIGAVGQNYYLSILPGDFDAAKASNWQGAICENGVLTNLVGIEGENIITYDYDAGNGNTVKFTLTYTDAVEITSGTIGADAVINAAPDDLYICDDTSSLITLDATFQYNEEKKHILDITDYIYISNKNIDSSLDVTETAGGDEYISAFDIYWQAYNAGTPANVFECEYKFDMSYVDELFCGLTAVSGYDLTYSEWGSLYSYQLYENGEGIAIKGKPYKCKIAQRGDSTLDHIIDAKDASAIAKYTAESSASSNVTINSSYNELAMLAADTNNDGVIDAKDAANVAKFTAQKALYNTNIPQAQAYYEIWNGLI